MGPPNKVLMPPSLAFDQAEVLRRLDRLERSSGLRNQSVTDGSGQTRIAVGSPFSDGTYGMRNYDASGNLLFDSTALSRVMLQLGFAIASASLTVTAAAYSIIPSCSVTFTLAHRTHIYAVMLGQANGTGQAGVVDPFLDGGSIYTGSLMWGAGGVLTTSSWAFSQLLSAGTHTIDLRASLLAIPGSFTVLNAVLDVYSIGTDLT